MVTQDHLHSIFHSALNIFTPTRTQVNCSCVRKNPFPNSTGQHYALKIRRVFVYCKFSYILAIYLISYHEKRHNALKGRMQKKNLVKSLVLCQTEPNANFKNQGGFGKWPDFLQDFSCTLPFPKSSRICPKFAIWYCKTRQVERPSAETFVKNQTLTNGADAVGFELFWFWALATGFDLVELDELLEDFFDLLLVSPAIADDEVLLERLVKYSWMRS